MTKQVQRRRGTATQHTSFTGAEGEVSVNTTNKSVHVHDGVTAGGIEGARADLTNVSDSDLNARLTGNTLSSLTITSADINGGTIDGTVIGGTTPAAGNFTTGSFTGDVSFGDNDKAIFGAGSDLQIYHSGSNSHITEGGTGNLIIRADDFRVQSNAGEEYIAADANGAVSLRYDNAAKLATTSTGIDVTGTVTADGLTSQGTLGNWSIDSQGVIQTFTRPSTSYIRASDAAGNIGIQTGGSKNSALFASNGDISFYEDTGTTPKFFWDASAEALGIGTSSPSQKLDVSGNARLVGSDPYLQILRTSDFYYGKVSADGFAAFTNTNGSAPVIFKTATTERMRIDSSGNLLVGKTTPSIATAGTAIRGDNAGLINSARAGTILELNRLSTDGSIVDFFKNGSTVGSIGNAGADVYFRKASGAGVYCSGSAVLPFGSHSLGQSTDRWSDLYLSGGVYLGGTGAANKLDDYEEGTWTPTCAVGATVNTAKYVKIGSQVTITAYMVINGNSNSTHANIGGLPFLSTSAEYAPAPLNHNQTAGTPLIRVEQNSTLAFVIDFNNVAVPFSAFSSGIFIFSLTYTTSA